MGKLYNYAPLETILDAIRATEAANGFRHAWDTEDLDNGGVRVVCRISHIEGHSEQGTVTIPPTKGQNTNQAQDKGVIISYGQRRSLLNAYGLATGGEDTDARSEREQAASEGIDAFQVDSLRALLKAKGRDESKMLDWAKVANLADMTLPQYNEAMRMLNKVQA